MGYKREDNANILTNIRNTRVDITNPCHRSVVDSSPYEYWRFEEVEGSEFSGIYNRSSFRPYNGNPYYMESNIDGLKNSSGIRAGKHNSPSANNFLFTSFPDYVSKVGEACSLEFWVKLKEHDGIVFQMGNDQSEFGEKNIDVSSISQFLLTVSKTSTETNSVIIHSLHFNLKIWIDEPVVGNGLPAPTEEKEFVVNNVDLRVYHDIVLRYEGNTTRGFQIAINKTVEHESILANELPANQQTLLFALGHSVDNLETIEPYDYDEISFYDRYLEDIYLTDHFDQCFTHPAIAGWNPDRSSKHYQISTMVHLNDYGRLYGLGNNIWNNAKGYKSNSGGRVEFELIIHTNENDSIIGIGVADQKASIYGQMGSAVPCSDDAMVLFYQPNETHSYRFNYALARNYGSIDIASDVEIHDGSIATISVDFTGGEIFFKIDGTLVYSFIYTAYISTPNLYPAISMRGTGYSVQIDTVGEFSYGNANYNPWGTLFELPNFNSGELLVDSEWEATYQGLILRDTPQYYWRFQEINGTIAIDEIKGELLTHDPGVGIARSGAEGFGVYYSGTNKTQRNNFANLSNWIEGSIEFWIKYDGADSSTGRILDIRSVDSDWGIRVSKAVDSLNNPILTCTIFESNESGTVYSYTLPLDFVEFGKWNHVVLTINSLRLFTAYVNSRIAAQMCGVNWANKFKNYFISINPSVSATSSFYFDEFALYNYILSEEQIRHHYQVAAGIISNAEDLNLIFKGIPNHFTSTEEAVFSTQCPGIIREWHYSPAISEWVERVTHVENIRQITSSYHHIMYLTDDNIIGGIGRNSSGQRVPPPSISGGINMISAGDEHSIALRANGTVVAWGDNSWGQQNVPSDLVSVVQIASGESHNAALKTNGSVVCWGRNDSGQSTVPEDFNDVIQVSCGGNFTVALRLNGTIVVWGDNTWGVRDIPADAINITQISAIGSAEHIVAMRSDGRVVCWGYNSHGQCDVPLGMESKERVSSGANASYAIDADGRVCGWGNVFRTNAKPKRVSELVRSGCGEALSHCGYAEYTWDDFNNSGFEFIPDRPYITSPDNGEANVGLMPRLTSSPFTSRALTTHVASYWEIYRNGVLIHQSGRDTNNLIGYPMPNGILQKGGATYHVRVMHEGERLSDFSQLVAFTTDDFEEYTWDDFYNSGFINLPLQPTSVYPGDGETNVVLTPTFRSSDFTSTYPNDGHVATYWEIYRNGVLIHQSGRDTNNLISYTVPSGILHDGEVEYSVRFRHEGIERRVGEFSELASFTTIFEEYTWDEFNSYGLLPAPNQPYITHPSGGSENFDLTESFNSSVFSSFTDNDNHIASYWEIYDSNGVLMHASGRDINNLISYQAPLGVLEYNMVYRVRVMHEGIDNALSIFSEFVQFMTKMEDYEWDDDSDGSGFVVMEYEWDDDSDGSGFTEKVIYTWDLTNNSGL